MAPDKKSEIQAKNSEQHKKRRSSMAPEKKSEIQAKDSKWHKKIRSSMAPEKKSEIQAKDTQRHRTVYKPVKANEHAMQLERNAYMKQVCLDCARGEAPAPLAEQEFTKYFMTQWSDRQMEWRIPQPCSICHGAWPTREKAATICKSCNEISKKCKDQVPASGDPPSLPRKRHGSELAAPPNNCLCSPS